MNRSEAGKLGYAKTRRAMIASARRLKQKARAAHAQAKKKCLFCRKLLPYRGWTRRQFCNHSCAASHINRLRGRKPMSRACTRCSAPVRNRKYCSGCWREVGIGCSSLADAKKDQTRRSFLLRTRGRRCEVCRRVRWMGKEIPIELHHKDGCSDHNTDENLQLLCPNCHAQTKTYKGKNRGNGRKNRPR